MEHLYLTHLLFLFPLLLLPIKNRSLLVNWQDGILMLLLWSDLLNHLYLLLSNQLLFWELCAFYERIFQVEWMFWVLFFYHHIAAFVGLLLTIDYFRSSRLFTFFWVFLAAAPLLINWMQSVRQIDLAGQPFYELPELSVINRDITSLIIEFNFPLTIGYGIVLLLVFLILHYYTYKQKLTNPKW